ncbi:MAG TPA: hypothetical protein VMN99_12425 [Anaerolineales bacterium]|nr:hypothetical protein [Anaerolineales bacterium]
MSNWRVDRWVVIAIAALVAVLFYLIVSALIFRIGFPLDDSWIHLTYARNLAQHGEWAFQLGQPSAGSTSPLWTALLSIGFLINLAPYVWTYLLGWAVLTLLAVYAENVARMLVTPYRSPVPWVGLFLVFAWHLTWSAVSGMETLLHGLIILTVLGALMSGSRRYLALGLLVGLSAWVRPDGLTLLGPIFFVALLSEKSWYLRREAIWKTLLGFGSLFFLYLLFNLSLSGNPMPNTFYAKQAEYESYWLSKTLVERVSNYLWPILASPFLALVPGAFLWLTKRIRAQNWGALASLIWFLGYIAIYFTRLPAYQHGRYLIPAFPIMYLWGLLGLLEFVLSPRANKRIVYLWQVATAILCLAFGIIGARQNAYDVSWIESEMVATANWVNANIPADARLAVHDIGVLGFYVQNPLVDMAGLVTPDVIPFIRDETRLAEYLDSNSVDYLITFPSFYPHLTSQRESVFVAELESEPGRFDESMQIYRWE